MDTNQITVCGNCSKPLPAIGFFCGGCLMQFKCKSCGAFLEKDNAGCVICGTPREKNINSTSTNGQQSVNTFRLHETVSDRTIEATFSDNVGKDLASILRDAYSIKQIGKSASANGFPKQTNGSENDGIKPDETIQEAETINIDSDSQKENADQEQPPSPVALPNEYPTLKAIAMKNLPSTEPEWIVVYAFYASKFGKETFTRKNLIEKYGESNRLDNDKKNALSSNIKSAVKSGYINPLQIDFSILDDGIKKAKEIISRTSSSTPKVPKRGSKPAKDKNEKDDEGKSKKGTKASSGTGKSLKRLAGLNFFPSGKESLEDFYKKFPTNSNNERNLLFVFYLQEILKINGITFDHIYTCYDALGLTISENLPQTVRNTKSKTGWIETVDKMNITVTVKGANQIKAWTKKA